MTLQELQAQISQLPLKERWQLVQHLLGSIQQETLDSSLPLKHEQAFSQIQRRIGTSGQASASIKGTGIRVQTIVIAKANWGWDTSQISNEYDLPTAQVSEALSFYEVHKAEIDDAITSEAALEAATYV